MGSELTGQVSGHLGPVDERRDAARHHDLVGGDPVAVRQGDDEAPLLLLDARDTAPVDERPYDYLIQALAGTMSLTGDPDGEPTKYGISIVDHTSGLLAAFAILAALREV